jgi:predicted AAA+ superfamily ATPase
MDVYVTGNFAKLLSKGVVTQFAGRGDVVHVYPLSFAEFMSVYKGDQYAGLEEYMLYGGIPWVVLQENVNDKAKVEFKETMLSIKPENYFKEWTETKAMFEKKYGQDVNVWFEELKETDEWKALSNKAKQKTVGKIPTY